VSKAKKFLDKVNEEDYLVDPDLFDKVITNMSDFEKNTKKALESMKSKAPNDYKRISKKFKSIMDDLEDLSDDLGTTEY